MNNDKLNIFGHKFGHQYTITGDAKKGNMEIKGLFIPEDSDRFFNQLHQWVDHLPEYSKKRDFQVLIKIVYANNAVKKHLYRLMKEFDELVKKHHYRIKIYWFYEENDEDNMEEGEDILEFYVKESHFRLIEVDKLQDYL